MVRRGEHQRRRGNGRNNAGVSLTELVVASLLLGVALAVVAELMSTSVVANVKLTRQFDAQVAARITLDRIKNDVRMAAAICPGKYCTEQVFVQNHNEYVHGTPPAAVPMDTIVLSPQTLILHLPIYFLDKANDPQNAAYVPGAAQNPLNGVLLPGYDTVIYEVVPDTINTGQYMLQQRLLVRQEFRLNQNCSYRQAIVDPQPVVRGIVGPLALNAQPGSVPKVFSYLSKNPISPFTGPGHLDLLKDSALSAGSSIAPYAAKGVNGVGIDMELRRADASTATGQAVDPTMEKILAVHAEACLRLPQNEMGLTEAYYEE